MANYLLSNDAVADLQAIWFYGANQWDITQADKYAIKIDKMCEFLLDNPGVGKNRDEIMTGLKSHSIGSHSIYYVEQKQTILVVRILHQSMDSERHLLN